MAGFQSVQDIQAWQVAMELFVAVHARFSIQDSQGHFWLRDQILKASLSLTNNIAEGFGRGSDAEFARFLAFARGSAFEVISILHAAERIGYLTSTEATLLHEIADRCTQLVSRLQTYLDPKRLREDEASYRG